MLKVMAQVILRFIAQNLQSTDFISVMIDECTDSTNRGQVALYNIYLIFVRVYVISI